MTDDGVRIRRARPADGAALSAYTAALMGEGLDTIGRFDPPPSPEDETRWIETAHGTPFAFVLVALVGPEVVGLADFRPDRINAHRTPGGMFGMSVARSWRRCGVGRRLLAALIGEALRERPDLARIDLEVVPWNKAAIALYESFGFVQEGRKRCAAVDAAGHRRDLLLMGRVF